MMVPLDFLLPNRGRWSLLGSPAFGWSWSLRDDDEEVVLMSSGYEARRSTALEVVEAGGGYGEVVEDWRDISG